MHKKLLLFCLVLTSCPSYTTLEIPTLSPSTTPQPETKPSIAQTIAHIPGTIRDFIGDFIVEPYGAQPCSPDIESYIRDYLKKLNMNFADTIIIRKLSKRMIYGGAGPKGAFAICLPFKKYLYIAEDWFKSLSDNEKRGLIAHESTHLREQHPLILLTANITYQIVRKIVAQQLHAKINKNATSNANELYLSLSHQNFTLPIPTFTTETSPETVFANMTQVASKAISQTATQAARNAFDISNTAATQHNQIDKILNICDKVILVISLAMISRYFETRADTYAMTTDPDGTLKILKQFESQEQELENELPQWKLLIWKRKIGKFINSFFATHPTTIKRIEHIKKVAKQRNLQLNEE